MKKDYKIQKRDKKKTKHERKFETHENIAATAEGYLVISECYDLYLCITCKNANWTIDTGVSHHSTPQRFHHKLLKWRL